MYSLDDNEMGECLSEGVRCGIETDRFIAQSAPTVAFQLEQHQDSLSFQLEWIGILMTDHV